MIIVDSIGWIEYFANGALADVYEKYLLDPDQIVTPSIIFYEVYKKVKRERGEENALTAAAQLMKTEIVPLDSNLALLAGDCSLSNSLPMADAIIYATALHKGCTVVTSDEHFKDLDNVIFIPRI